MGGTSVFYSQNCKELSFERVQHAHTPLSASMTRMLPGHGLPRLPLAGLVV